MCIRDSPEIPDSVLLEMKQERLEKVIDRLPPGDKAILMMKYIDDMQIREIGDVLGKTESAVKMQICLLYTSPSPRDRTRSRMPSSAWKKKNNTITI